MRWSNLFVPTLRENPSQAESQSHKLLLRAGYIRQLSSGLYVLLPMAVRVRSKILEILRDEMQQIGAQEFSTPCLQPLDIWKESGRAEELGELSFALKDRKGAELVLATTAEEVFTSIFANGVSSHKQLPQIWYQIQCKFRDEQRPRSGLFRLREFLMKDSYSFDSDENGLQCSFQLHKEAYCRFFSHLGLDCKVTLADSASTGDCESYEFTLLSEAGEDTLVSCTNCPSIAKIELASSVCVPGEEQNPRQREEARSLQDAEASTLPSDAHEVHALEEFATPNVRTIKQLCEYAGVAAQKQIKTLVFKNESGLIIALMRGDHELNETKLKRTLQCKILEAAGKEDIFAALGAHPGSLGACGIKTGDLHPIKQIVADEALRGAVEMLTGANKDDFHFKGVSVERDISPSMFADLRKVRAGECCTICGGALELRSGLKLGHIFKLGTRYSQKMNACILSADGSSHPVQMGSYGIGIERTLQAIAETFNDEDGLKWPLPVAPFQIVVVPVQIKDQQQREAAESLYNELAELGFDVLFDDRDERAGVKFKDSDLVGIPFRITIGKGVSSGRFELFCRDSREKQEMMRQELLSFLKARILSAKINFKPAGPPQPHSNA